MEAAAPERADGGSDGEEESSGIAAPLESLPPTVVFFDVPPRQSSGFVLDFGEPERPPDLSPRRNSSGPLDLITLLTEEAAETPAAAAPAELGWLKRRQAQRGRPAAGAGAKAGGAPKPKAPSKQQRIAAASMVLSQEQLEELSSHFRAVPLAEVRSGHVHFTRLAAGVAPAEGFGGEPTIERRQLPELFVLIGLRLTLRMGGAPTDRFRFRDVLRILQALRDEEAMMQIPISPMPDEHAGADEEEMLMHTNPLFLAMKQRDDGALGAGVLELSGANRAVLLLPCNARLEGVEITRELVEAHVAQRIADLDAAEGAEAPPPTAFRTLSGLSLDIDGDVLRIGAGAGAGSGAVAGPTLQVLEREQFFDEDCLRHEVLWLSDILSESSAEQQAAEGDGAAEGPGADGVMTALQAYTLFDHRNSYQEMMAFLFMFTPPPGSPGSGLTEAVAAAARVNQAASTMLSEILAARGGNGTGGRLRGRRRSVSSLGSLGRGNPKLSTEAALTTRLGQFVREARVWQSAAADRVARSLMEANRRVSGERDAGRQLQSLRGAVGAYIAAETHRLVVQVLRRAYEHEDIALAAKIGVWASLADEEIVAAGLPPRPTGFDLAEGASIFQGLEEASTPQDKLLVVKRATWAIQGAQALPADDLLPLFVELLAQASPPYLFSTLCYINFFYSAQPGADELSYHATNLRAAAAIIGLRCPWEGRQS